ncbi:hypothetical protein TCAL_06300 [Tigriopus californicus]|uniref:Peptidase C1A papain C-terminal domain-containing protein n=1 Tax=Tigriopus californicus TaxID=6832 RepID=A0A553PSR3_TIGCA|nr:hypothetical protein TCAL_06300 [Tigriopus californicus]
MDSRQLFLVALAISIGALLVAFFKNAPTEEMNYEGFMETDPEYEYNHVDPSLVDYYTNTVDEIMFKMSIMQDHDGAEKRPDWKEMTDMIRAQNMAFKASGSQFYCKPNSLLFFPTLPEESSAFFESQKCNKHNAIFNDWEERGEVIVRQLPPNEDPKEYVDRLMKIGNAPPSEFHAPKGTFSGGQIGPSMVYAAMDDIKGASVRQKSPNLVVSTYKSSADNKDEPDLSPDIEHWTCFEGAKSIADSNDSQPKEKSEQYHSKTDNTGSDATLVELVSLETDGEEKLKALIATFGVVVSSVSIGADGSYLNRMFKSYGGGIFDYCQTGGSEALDSEHEVVIVGYGISEGTKYWEVRNTWGADWGESGLFKIKRGVNCNRIEEVSGVWKILSVQP